MDDTFAQKEISSIGFARMTFRNALPPLRKTPKSAGIDLFIPGYSPDYQVRILGENPAIETLDKDGFVLPPQSSVMIPLGIRLNIPEGFFMLLRPKSGIGLRTETVLLADTIDQDYQGEVMVVLINTGKHPRKFFFCQAVVQGVLLPTVYLPLMEKSEDDLYTEKTVRGEGGFGSTGIFQDS